MCRAETVDRRGDGVNGDRVLELWAEFTAGGNLTPAEKSELLGALQADENLRRKLMRNDEIDALLQGSARKESDGASFPEVFAQRLAAQHDATRFVDKIRTRLGEETLTPRRLARHAWRAPRGEASRRLLLPALVAASLLLTIIVTMAGHGGVKPSPQGIERRPESPEIAHPEPASRPPVAEQSSKSRDSRPPKAADPAPRPSDQPDPKPARPEPPRPEVIPTPEPATPREDNAPAKPPAPAPAVPRKTESVAATLEQVEGDAGVLAGASRTPAKAGQGLLAGQGLGVAGPKGFAAVLFPDKTRLEIDAGTELTDLFDVDAPGKDARGKRLFLKRGTLTAAVARQPADRPMVVRTPHGEARVVGTTLRLVVEPGSTRLEVMEGRVQLKRFSDGKTADVPAGHFAVAATGADFAAKFIPVDEILLLPRPEKVKLIGEDWKLIRDEKAPGGLALDVPWSLKRLPRGADKARHPGSFASFTFQADAGKDYSVWVRGYCSASKDRLTYDCIGLEAVNGEFSRSASLFGAAGKSFMLVDNLAAYDTYGWINDQHPTTSPSPVTVRFARTGTQTLRLYALEAPVRIAAVWLSATQRSLPPADQEGPKAEKK